MMKKALIGVLLLLATVGLCAQEKWSFSLLPGYQFSNGDSRAGFVGSLDGAYYFTDRVGLHFAYMYNEGKFRMNVPTAGNFDFKHDYSLVEVGPEFVGKAGQKGQIYGQINAGYTFGSTSVTAYGMTVNNVMGNDWTFGLAFGYRYFFYTNVAFAVQGAYHHINGWSDSGWAGPYRFSFDGTNSWDARVGFHWKF